MRNYSWSRSSTYQEEKKKKNQNIPQDTKQLFIVLHIYIHITQATDR